MPLEEIRAFWAKILGLGPQWMIIIALDDLLWRGGAGWRIGGCNAAYNLPMWAIIGSTAERLRSSRSMTLKFSS